MSGHTKSCCSGLRVNPRWVQRRQCTHTCVYYELKRQTINASKHCLGLFIYRKKFYFITNSWHVHARAGLPEEPTVKVIFGQIQYLRFTVFLKVYSSHNLVKLLRLSVFFIWSSCKVKFSHFNLPLFTGGSVFFMPLNFICSDRGQSFKTLM